MEDMRNAVTSTPAGEPLALEYEENTTESSCSSDTSEYTYESESDESERSFHGFSHKDYLRQIGAAQAIEKQSTQVEVDTYRDDLDYEWDELETAHMSEEEGELVQMWEYLLQEAKIVRRCVKLTITKGLREFTEFVEVTRQPEEINKAKTKLIDELFDVEGEVHWQQDRLEKFMNENTRIPFNELMNRLEETRELVVAARIDLETAVIAGIKPNITLGKYELTEIQEEHTEQIVTQGDMFRGGMPGEPFQRELISRLINNSGNNRLTEDLMNTMLAPYTNRIIQDDTEEAQTSHQKSFQKEIEEHQRNTEREQRIERERKREPKHLQNQKPTEPAPTKEKTLQELEQDREEKAKEIRSSQKIQQKLSETLKKHREQFEALKELSRERREKEKSRKDRKEKVKKPSKSDPDRRVGRDIVGVLA